MPTEYVEQRNGGYYVVGTRVSLDSVVYAFLRGEIANAFPALSLEQAHGAIAYYLANRTTRCLPRSRKSGVRAPARGVPPQASSALRQAGRRPRIRPNLGAMRPRFGAVGKCRNGT